MNNMPKPKYQIGDEVWVIRHGKAVKGEVTRVLMMCGEKTNFFRYATSPIGYLIHNESDLFPTKEELLASL